MELNYEIFRSDQHKKSIWSGGTTTELFIYPPDSAYEKRNFTWRISSATVDAEKSEFTILTDYNRILMVLDGKLKLNHQGKNVVNLSEFEQNFFDGSLKTVSEGKVTDYNVMMRKGSCEGNVEIIQLESKSTLTTIFNEEKMDDFCYCADTYYNIGNTVNLSINESKKIVLEKRDLLIVYRKNEKQEILFDSYNSGDEEVLLIKSKLFY